MKIQYKDKEIEVKEGKTIQEVLEEEIKASEYSVVGAIFNNEYENLNYEIHEDGKVELVDISSKEGSKIYRRTLTYILGKAFEKVCKDDVGYKFLSKSIMVDSAKIAYSVLLFLSVFIGLIFFVTSSSFLYNKLYVDCQVDKKKYSVRFIQSVSDKYSTYLYRKISNDETGWYVILDDIDSKEINTSPIAKNVIKEIEEEMTKLENIGFDDMVKGSIAYKKNKDSDYKIYISKFDSLNTKQEQFIEEFSTKYNESHITPLNDNELTNIALIYNLVAKVNNGIVKVLSNKPNKNYNLNERSTPSNYYKAYLDSLNISIDDSFFTLNANAFMMNVIITYSNSCGAKGLSLNDMINNFDMYYFLDKIENSVVKKNLSVSDERIQKIILDLKQIYNIITTKNNGLDELFNNFKRANEIILNIMSRDNNLNYYIRVS